MQQTDSLIDEKKEPSWVGYVDNITDTSVHGWICDSNNFDLSLEVEIYANEVKIGETLANNHRPDLQNGGLGNGNYGFNFNFPMSVQGQKIIVKVKNYDYEVSKSGALLEKEGLTQDSPPETTKETKVVETEIQETQIKKSDLTESSLEHNRQQENEAIENWLIGNKKDYQFSNEAFPVVININPYQVNDKTFVEMAQPLSDEDFIRAAFIVYLGREPATQEQQMCHSDIRMRDRYVLPRALRQTSAFLDRRSAYGKENFFRKIFKTIFRYLRILITRNRFIKIIDVANPSLSDQKNFWGGWIDIPEKNRQYLGKQLQIGGWVLGKKYPVISLKLTLGKKVIQEVPVNGLRPDVVKSFTLQSNGWLEFCGYNATLNLKNLPPEGILRLEAVFSNNQVLLAGNIKFTK